MKLTIDTQSCMIVRLTENGREEIPLYSPRGFEVLSDIWLKVGWDQKYPYTFTWLGRPIIQLPEDVLRIQEVIHRLQPDVLIETGVAHGGSLILYATLFKAIGKGRIIGIDIEIRRHNRKAIESHSLASFITLVEGSSTDPIIVEKVKAYLRPEEKVLVILDACHSTDFVQRELEAYHQLVSVGSYIVATDGIMKDLYDTPRGKPAWTWDNPVAAARRFLETHPEFTMEQPPWLFSESTLSKNVTHWPSAYLKRLR